MGSKKSRNPAEPSKRWVADTSGEAVEPMQAGFASDYTAYQIPEQDSLKIDPRLLKAIYANIFEREPPAYQIAISQSTYHFC